MIHTLPARHLRYLFVAVFVLAATAAGRTQETVAGKWTLNIDSP